MVSVAKSLFDRGYSTGGGGNLSLRLPDNFILATPTGSCLGRLEIDSLSVVSLDGELLSGKKASKEVEFHLSLYRANTGCNAVVHLHSTYMTALSCIDTIDEDQAIRPFTPYYVMRIGNLPVVDYYPPGSPQIAEALEKLAPIYRAFLLRNHGPVVTGKDLYDAADNSEELEETAKLMFILQNFNVRYLSTEEITDLIGKKK